jgi:Flp pilus assembly protein TadD
MIAFCACLALCWVCGVVFSPLLTAELINADDHHYLYGPGQGGGVSWHAAEEAFRRFQFPTGTGGYYQPLTTLSFTVEGWLTQDPQVRAFQGHLTNIFLHLVNVVIVFVLVRRLSGSTFWSALLAALFGLHPLQVESVAWIFQRMTLLGTLFCLLALYCYVRYAARERLFWLAPTAILYCAAVLSKPTFLGLPIVLLILDIRPLERSGGSSAPRRTADAEARPSPKRSQWRPIAEKIPLFALMLVAGAMQLRIYEHVEPTAAPGIGGFEVLARNMSSFLWRIVWPVDLSPFYPLTETGLGMAGTWLAGIPVLVLLVVLFVVSFRWARPVFAAFAGATVLVFPATLNMPYTNQLLGDECLYPVLIVPVLIAGDWIRRKGIALRTARQRMAAVCIVGVAAILGTYSNLQAGSVWLNSRQYYEHAIARYPNWAPGYLGLVRAYFRRGDLDSALRYAERAVDIDPDNPNTQFYLGRVLLHHRSGRSSEAIGPLRKALASDPDWIDCLQDLGAALAENGKPDEAVVYLERARDLRPRSATILLHLGLVYLDLGRPSSARRELQLSLNEQTDPITHLALARAWAAAGQEDYARRHLETAVELNSQMAVAAADAPELWKLRDEPGFESLIDGSHRSAERSSPAHRPERPSSQARH